jgi:hypothetical protein
MNIGLSGLASFGGEEENLEFPQLTADLSASQLIKKDRYADKELGYKFHGFPKL